MSWLRSPMYRLPARSPMDIRRSKRYPPLFPPGVGLKQPRPAPTPKGRGAPRLLPAAPPGPPAELK